MRAWPLPTRLQTDSRKRRKLNRKKRRETVIVGEYIRRRGHNDLCLCAAHREDIDAAECDDEDDPGFCQIDIIDAIFYAEN